MDTPNPEAFHMKLVVTYFNNEGICCEATHTGHSFVVVKVADHSSRVEVEQTPHRGFKHLPTVLHFQDWVKWDLDQVPGKGWSDANPRHTIAKDMIKATINYMETKNGS